MEKLRPLSPRSGTRQGSQLSPLLCKVILKVIDTAIRQEIKVKGIQFGKEIKLSLFEDDLILYIKNFEVHQKCLKVINLYSKTVGYKINKQKSATFLCENSCVEKYF